MFLWPRPALATRPLPTRGAIACHYLQPCWIRREEVGVAATAAAALRVGKVALGKGHRAVEHLWVDTLHYTGCDAVVAGYPSHNYAVGQAAHDTPCQCSCKALVMLARQPWCPVLIIYSHTFPC